MGRTSNGVVFASAQPGSAEASYSDAVGRIRARELGADVVIALIVFAALVAAIVARLDGTEPGWPAYLFAFAMAAVLLLRRRFPVQVLVAAAVLLVVYHASGQPALPLALPVVVALYSAAERGRLRWAVGTAAMLVVVSTVARLLEGDSLAWLAGYDLVSQVGLMAATIALGDAVRSRRGWREQLRRQEAAAAAEREREATRRAEQERLRIARDLHDVLAHALSVVSLHSDVAREALEDTEPDTVAAASSLSAVRQAARAATRELRATVGSLRSSPQPVPGLDRLDELVRAAADGGLVVELLRDGDLQDVPAVVASTAYRIVQESLTNVRRHADARKVTVDVCDGRDALIIRISDDGTSSRVAAQGASGYGLLGMRERAGLLGGRVCAGPTESGWTVEAVLPFGGAP